MAASGVIYTSHFLWAGVTAARHFRAQAPLFAASIALSLLLCTLLVPRFGLTGAAMAILIVAVFQCVGMGLILRNAIQACGRSPQVSALPPSHAGFLEYLLASKDS